MILDLQWWASSISPSTPFLVPHQDKKEGCLVWLSTTYIFLSTQTQCVSPIFYEHQTKPSALLFSPTAYIFCFLTAVSLQTTISRLFSIDDGNGKGHRPRWEYSQVFLNIPQPCISHSGCLWPLHLQKPQTASRGPLRTTWQLYRYRPETEKGQVLCLYCRKV